MLETYGTKSLGEVLAPSIQYAERGVPHYESMVQRLGSRETREQFDLYPPGGTDVFFDNGHTPRPGSLLVQSALAGTLKRLVAAESAAPGHRLDGLRAARDSFYRGDIARAIVDSAQSVGGILSLEDLSAYQAKYEEPVKTTFMGYEVHGQSTWTQAPVLMQTLSMLERFDLRAMGHNSPEYIHTVVEALKLALADRQAHYGDPDFAEVPIDGLLSKEYGAERAKLIDAGKACPELPAAGDPWRYSKRAGAPAAGSAAAAGAGGDASDEGAGTTHIAVLDRDGNMVCATPSGGEFDSSVFFPELGCAPSTRIQIFNFDKGHPNRLEPGKRPRTTLVNYILSKNGVPVMTVGCPGGDRQAQANVQTILNTLLFDMNPQEAIEAPRFATDSMPNSFYPHTYLPGQLSVEQGFRTDTVRALEALGHRVTLAATCGSEQRWHGETRRRGS